MAIDKKGKGIDLKDLTPEQQAELERQILEKQPKTVPADASSREFRVQIPPAIEGGSKPADVSKATTETIVKHGEGISDASLLTVPDAKAGGSEVRSAQLLEDLINGNGDPADLQESVLGPKRTE